MLDNILLLPGGVRQSSMELSRHTIPVSYIQFWTCFLNRCINFFGKKPVTLFLANALLFYSSDKAWSVKCFFIYLRARVDITKKEAVLEQKKCIEGKAQAVITCDEMEDSQLNSEVFLLTYPGT